MALADAALTGRSRLAPLASHALLPVDPISIRKDALPRRARVVGLQRQRRVRAQALRRGATGIFHSLLLCDQRLLVSRQRPHLEEACVGEFVIKVFVRAHEFGAATGASRRYGITLGDHCRLLRAHKGPLGDT